MYIFTGQKQLENDLAPVAADWKSLGVQLGIKPDTLKARCGTNDELSKERFEKTMNEWLENVAGAKTWKQIIEALKSPPVLRMDVVRTLEGFILCCLINILGCCRNASILPSKPTHKARKSLWV